MPGLPVHHCPVSLCAVVGSEHRVDPAADGGPGDRDLERHLDIDGRAIRPFRGEEGRLQGREILGVFELPVAIARQIFEIDETYRSVVTLHPGVEGGAAPGFEVRTCGARAGQPARERLRILTQLDQAGHRKMLGKSPFRTAMGLLSFAQ